MLTLGYLLLVIASGSAATGDEQAFLEARRRAVEARSALELTTRTNPRHLMAHVKLCRVYLELGELQKADAALGAARRLSPNSKAVASISELVAQRKVGR